METPCWLAKLLFNNGLCPQGWHVPSDKEWETLVSYLGENPGTKMKAKSGWNKVESGGSATCPVCSGWNDEYRRKTARCLVSAGDEKFQLRLFAKIIEDQLSVRELEVIIRDGENIDKKTGKKVKTIAEPLTQSQDTFCYYLADKVSSNVDIRKTGLGNGKIIIHFDSEVDLNRIIEIMNK